MRRPTATIVDLLVLIAVAMPLAAVDGFAARRGPYLGLAPPGTRVEVFAPGLVSTSGDQVSTAFQPGGRELYYCRFRPGRGYEILWTRETDAGWLPPERAPFASEHSEVDPFITPDGGWLYFISKRPRRSGEPRSPGYQLWRVAREGAGWGAPTHLGAVVNSGGRQLFPTVSRDGTLYFNSDRGGFGKGDVFRSRRMGGRWVEPQNLGPSINTEYDETDLLVAPDESWVVFTSIGRPDGLGSGDLYVSFRQRDGSWSPAVHMGPKINTASSEFCPALSPDGRYLFFTSGRRGDDDIYWVDASILERYRPKPETLED